MRYIIIVQSTQGMRALCPSQPVVYGPYPTRDHCHEWAALNVPADSRYWVSVLVGGL